MSAPRKRNNSIIPLEFRNDTSDGGMERAALATVFGVREYTESKIFWNTDDEPAQDITTPTATSTLQRNTSKKSYTTASHRGSTIMMQTSSVSPPIAPPPPQHRTLPKIPVVSEFGDIWSDTQFSATSKEDKEPVITDNASKLHPFQLLPPTDLSDFPLTIFDLLESDENPNLILWGIDAKQHTTIPSTAPSTADEREYTTHNKKKSRWSAQQLIPLKLKKKTSVDLSSAVPEPPASQEAERVIEAATIEKLVEKLTISLDYAFMTDFFLIYRVFMTPLQLCKLLILRFNWSLEKNEAKRCIVRIRTFVVMRHWLLNYFLRDFIPSKDLRIVLTNFLNTMPYHPLIKQSPRDQRIIKGLKRVVRRLKKIYYASNASTRVQVIGPPPPTHEEQVVKQMVKDQLTSSSTIRQKTLNMVKGVHLDARHSYNTAVKNTHAAAPNVVVIGNYPSATTHQHHRSNSYIEQCRRRRGSSVSSTATSNKFNNGSSLPNSMYNLHNNVNNSASMEWINIQQQQQLNNSKSQDFYISNVSDNSLESAISPGTSDESDYAEDDMVASPKSYHSKELAEPAFEFAPSTNPPTALNSNNELTKKLEMVRQQQQQEEEERQQAEKFLASYSTNPTEATAAILSNSISDYTVRTRSFYSAQLAIPSTISTPDIYHPPANKTTDYFDSQPNNNLISSTSYNSMAYPSVTDSEVVTPSCANSGDPTTMVPRFRLSNYNLQQQHNRMSKTLAYVDPKSKPLPPLVLHDEKENSLTSASSIASSSYTKPSRQSRHEEKVEAWRLSTAGNKQQTNPMHPATLQTPKSRIFEIDIDTNRNNEFLSGLPPSIPMPNTVSTIYRSIVLSYSTSLMAQQFCLIERAILLDIDWEELVDCRWTKMSVTTLYQPPSMEDVDQDVTNAMGFDQHPQGIYSRAKRMKQQHERNKDGAERGIEKTINRFNAVCQWVSSEIVQTKQLDQRVKLIEKFIRLAKKCKLYCNFSTLIQILLGLQSSSVSRLEKTWPLVNKREIKTLQELSTFTSPTKNWKHIRDSMSQVAEEYGESPTEIQVEVDSNSTFRKRKTKKSVTIKLPFGGCIPFLGIYLSDLVFNAELPSYLPSSNNNIERKHQGSMDAVLSQPLVHFRKHRITATVIKRVLVFQNLARRYSFEESSDLLLFNTCFQVTSLDTDAIQKASYEIEPAAVVY
ncbi:Guanine nucleotide exchange factor lte1 [Mucor circinelloides]